MKNPTCSSCRRGEIYNPADYLVCGHDGDRPFRSHLCNDHIHVVIDDGGTISKQTPVSRSGWASEWEAIAKQMKPLKTEIMKYWNRRQLAPSELTKRLHALHRRSNQAWENGGLAQ